MVRMESGQSAAGVKYQCVGQATLRKACMYLAKSDGWINAGSFVSPNARDFESVIRGMLPKEFLEHDHQVAWTDSAVRPWIHLSPVSLSNNLLPSKDTAQ